MNTSNWIRADQNIEHKLIEASLYKCVYNEINEKAEQRYQFTMMKQYKVKLILLSS